MLKKRIIASIIVKKDIAMQSFSYSSYLPIGDPVILVENFDRWGVDEILVHSIDRSKDSLGPDIKLLKRIASMGISTPLIYGGGIQSVEEGISVIHSGAERLSLCSLITNTEILKQLVSKIGKQAIILSVPFYEKNKTFYLYNYLNKTLEQELNKDFFTRLQDYCSEIILIDAKNDGGLNSFNYDICNLIPSLSIDFICFGGITDSIQITRILSHQNIQAVAIANSLSYREHQYQLIKNSIKLENIRESKYQK